MLKKFKNQLTKTRKATIEMVKDVIGLQKKKLQPNTNKLKINIKKGTKNWKKLQKTLKIRITQI